MAIHAWLKLKKTTYTREVNNKCLTEPQPLCASIFSECDLEKIDAAQVCTREEANQWLFHPGDSVRDTIQKPACPLLDPVVQLGWMLYSSCNPQAFAVFITWQRETPGVMALTGAGWIAEEWGIPTTGSNHEIQRTTGSDVAVSLCMLKQQEQIIKSKCKTA